MGIMVKALVGSGNSTFAPSGWFMHAWSHIPTFRNVDGFAGSVCPRMHCTWRNFEITLTRLRRNILYVLQTWYIHTYMYIHEIYREPCSAIIIHVYTCVVTVS